MKSEEAYYSTQQREIEASRAYLLVAFDNLLVHVAGAQTLEFYQRCEVATS